MTPRLLPGRGTRSSYPRVLSRWRRALGHLSEEEVAQARSLFEHGLGEADSGNPYVEARSALLDLAAAADGAAELLRGLAEHVSGLQDEWAASHRYTPAGLDALEQELAALFADDSREAARRWLNELLDAMRAREDEAFGRLASSPFAFAAEHARGAEEIRARALGWLRGEATAGLELLDALARREVTGWNDIIVPATQSRAHRLAAWLALRVVGDAERALDHLKRSAKLDPFSGPSHADLAAFYLYMGEVDHAAPQAQRAIEVDPDDPAGYLELGAWAELAGQFDDARELFDRGLTRMPLHAMGMMRRRGSLLDPPGALLLLAAERLLDAGKATEAVETLEAALLAGIRGTQQFPDADAYRLLSVALERASGRTAAEAAAAAVDAAKRFLWNGQPNQAIEQLTRAGELDESAEEARWLLAEALTTISFPAGAAQPTPELVARAREAWDDASARFGAPKEASWAYLTRANIADLETYAPGRDRGLGLWEATLNVERALVHDQTDSRRWALAAHYLRACGLDLTALEAVERGFTVDPTDPAVLSERLALLANAGRIEEAVKAANALVAMNGDDPWVSGIQAWLALHQDRPADALVHLEAPLALEYDLGWYYSLRALCHLALDDVEGARGDYEAIRDRVEPLGGAVALQRATACIALGDLAEARALLELARADSGVAAGEYLTAEAFLALTEGDLPRAEELLTELLGQIGGVQELDDCVQEMRLRLRLFSQGEREARGAIVERVVEQGSAARRQELLAATPSPDREVGSLLEHHDQNVAGDGVDVPTAALLALHARRLTQAGALTDAAGVYERLRGSVFEPQATAALRRVLLDASACSVAGAEVDEVERIQMRLRELDLVDPVQAVLSVVTALETAGRTDEARARLAAALADESDAGRRQELQQRLGELALRTADFDEAGKSLEAALQLAQQRADAGRIAQVEARLGLVSFATEDREAGLAHLTSALAAWTSAGALDPSGPLEDDLRGLASAESGPAWAGPGAGAVQIALDALPLTRQAASTASSELAAS